MAPSGDYDPAFDKLPYPRWHVREVFVPTDQGLELDGMEATRRIGNLRLQVYQGCDAVYELRGQGRGRPKAHEPVGMEWYQPHWYLHRRNGGLWVQVAHGNADTVLGAIEVVERLARILDVAAEGGGGDAPAP